MITIDADLQPLRRAALLVHGMPEADAAWLLASLSPAQRAALEPLLQELGAIGLPRDPTLLPELPSDRNAPPALGRNRSLAALDRRGVASLESVLRTEPGGVVAALLSSGAWPWRARVARKWGVPLPVPSRDGGPHFGAALRQALVKAIEEQLSTAAERRRRSTRERWAGIWQRLRARSEP